MTPFQIAIDGPAGAGKSTVARMLADRLGYIHIDTGAMYRSVAALALRQRCSPGDVPCLVRLARSAEIRFEPGSRRVVVNGEDLTEEIRSQEVSDFTSQIAAVPEVRAALLEKQRLLAQNASIVMEGRDIGSVVLPGADLKVFLDAQPSERTRRRFLEIAGSGEEKSLETVASEIASRDHRDSTRAEAPLQRAEDALYMDSTGRTPEEMVEAIVEAAQRVHAGMGITR
jgi:cytidylate kinase